MKRFLVLATVGFVACVSGAEAAQLDIRTGLWEITSIAEAPGSSAKPEVSRACIDDQTLRRGTHFSPGKRGSCTRTLLHGSSRLIELRVECTGEQQASGTFRMQANDRQSVNGKLDLVVNSGSNPVTVKRSMRGVWLGNDCGTAKRDE